MEKQDEDQFTYTWIIENFSMKPYLLRNYHSSEFSMNSLPGIKWKLMLFSNVLDNVDKNNIKLEICGSDYVLENYKLSSRGELRTYNESIIVSLDPRINELKNARAACLGTLQSSFLPISWIKDILIVKCTLKLTRETNEEEIFPPLPYENGLFSDCVLRARDVSFKVHRAILEVRWPKLQKKLYAEKSKELVLDIGSNVLEAIIKYVYTGKIDFSKRQFAAEVSDAAMKYELPHLICTPTIAMTCRTQVNIGRVSFEWPIKNFSNLPVNTVIHSHVFTGDMKSWRWYLTFQVRDNALHDKAFDISLCGACEDEHLPIFVRSKISFDETNSSEYDYVFLTEEKWKCAEFSRSISPGSEDLLLLKCELKFSDGSYDSKIMESSNAFASSTNCKYFNSDMQKIYEIRRSDVSIKVKYRTFYLHKFILCARSSVFSKMFGELTKEWETSDEEPLVMENVFQFLYFRNFNFSEADKVSHMMKLYTAADKYNIPAMKKKCSCDLKSRLSVRKVCKLLHFAYVYSDDNLYDSILEFISANAEKVFTSDEWKEICDNNMYAKLLKKLIFPDNPPKQFT